jgi:hypothetical protein
MGVGFNMFLSFLMPHDDLSTAIDVDYLWQYRFILRALSPFLIRSPPPGWTAAAFCVLSCAIHCNDLLFMFIRVWTFLLFLFLVFSTNPRLICRRSGYRK